jgi:hypothetical protein
MEDLIRTTLKDTSFKGELVEQEEIVQAVMSQVPFILPIWS